MIEEFACVGQVLFRASSLRDAFSVFSGMVGRHGRGSGWPIAQILLIIGLFTVVWLMPNTQEILGEAGHDDQPNWSILPQVRWTPTFSWWIAISSAFALSMFYSTSSSTFLYFQF